ncbi:mevalonate pyrophosphate decarboxylase [Borreliella californiensis]|uniref:Mevalonate pyrophosphate decarboxylase n=1 Tax=Borreliella californiensis TaxID=373543 RepID=A0A7W9ZLL0_9SPIR|nr:mevalonate pyrophosphate decarboxylase [Borreliella californiensis]
MDINNYFNLNNYNIDSILKLIQEYQKVVNENKILKNSLKNSTKLKKESLKSNPKFYLTQKTSKLIEKCVKTSKQIDPISGWFVHLLLVSGCRGAEI